VLFDASHSFSIAQSGEKLVYTVTAGNGNITIL
jgi:hypothetical protein